MTRTLLALLLLGTSPVLAQQSARIHAHSHNDYEQRLPLEEALRSGFVSVEADVHLIDGEFYVAHDRPAINDASRTLRTMYLDPLMDWTTARGGRVYGGYRDFVYLMIDIKSDGAEACRVLESQLEAYSSIVSALRDTVDDRDKPLKVFVSGSRTGRPPEAFADDGYRLFALDGRPADLGKRIPVASFIDSRSSIPTSPGDSGLHLRGPWGPCNRHRGVG